MASRAPSVILELHSADRLIRTVVVEAFLAAGLHPSLFAILALIRIHEPITPTRLAEESGVRPSTLRDMVLEMTRAGHVAHLENLTDRRSYFLMTTPAGKAFLRRADRIVRAVEGDLESELGKPLEELRQPLRSLRKAAQDVWRTERHDRVAPASEHR